MSAPPGGWAVFIVGAIGTIIIALIALQPIIKDILADFGYPGEREVDE